MKKIIVLILLCSFIYLGLYSFKEMKDTQRAIQKRDEITTTQKLEQPMNQLSCQTRTRTWLYDWSMPIGIQLTKASRCKIEVNKIDKYWCREWTICLKSTNIFDEYDIKYEYVIIFSVIWFLGMLVFVFAKKKNI